MTRHDARPRWADASKCSTVLALAMVMLAGCSSTEGLGTRMSNLLGSSSGTAVASADGAARAPADVDCPGVEVRSGASSLAINATTREPDVNALRYQLSFSRFARECSVRGGVMNLRVGVVGRVVLGPAGTSGAVTVPLRLAVVREGPEPRPIVTTFHPISVTVPEGQTTATFTTVAEDLSFPVPGGSELDAYVVYVGFDPQTAARPAKAAPRRR